MCFHLQVPCQSRLIFAGDSEGQWLLNWDPADVVGNDSTVHNSPGPALPQLTYSLTVAAEVIDIPRFSYKLLDRSPSRTRHLADKHRQRFIKLWGVTGASATSLAYVECTRGMS
jgi:hypothetical protein